MAASNYNLERLFTNLGDWGLFDILAPFGIMMLLLYIGLGVIPIVKDKKNIKLGLSVLISLIVIGLSVTRRIDPNPVEIMQKALPPFMLVLLAIFALLIMVGFVGQETVFLGMTAPGWTVMICIAIVVIIFGGAAGWWSNSFGNTLEDFFGTEAVAVAIMLLFFGVGIAWITSEAPEKEDIGSLKRLGFDFSKLFGKGGGGHGGH